VRLVLYRQRNSEQKHKNSRFIHTTPRVMLTTITFELPRRTGVVERGGAAGPAVSLGSSAGTGSEGTAHNDTCSS
jgi:hypothetical protein